MSKKVVRPGSKIVKYKLEEDCIMLYKSGLSYEKIAEELNASGKVPPDDPISKFAVMRFIKEYPDLNKEIVRESKARLVKVVDANINIINETIDLFKRSKEILEKMAEDAELKNRHINPYQFKAIASEMRELLKMMTEIQKEINDYQNIKKFMEIVIEVLYEEVPEKIPVIAEKLKLAKGTQWFANLLEKTKRGKKAWNI